jgi:hypothetical protein
MLKVLGRHAEATAVLVSRRLESPVGSQVCACTLWAMATRSLSIGQQLNLPFGHVRGDTIFSLS